MKKLILGLLLIFSFSYGEENNYLAKEDLLILKTQEYALVNYDLPPRLTRIIIKKALQEYENIYGSENLTLLSMCLGAVGEKILKDFDECGINSTIDSFIYYLENFDEDMQSDITQVFSSFGVVLGVELNKKLKKKNGKKKRI